MGLGDCRFAGPSDKLKEIACRAMDSPIKSANDDFGIIAIDRSQETSNMSGDRFATLRMRIACHF
jgi:hypothetical protein